MHRLKAAVPPPTGAPNPEELKKSFASLASLVYLAAHSKQTNPALPPAGIEPLAGAEAAPLPLDEDATPNLETFIKEVLEEGGME